jgi:AcrR family transcriptional regulator
MATHVGLDHDAVVDEAGALVDESGIEALTLARLATRLGIRSQSLYAHVDGLDGLLRDLALDSVRRLGDQLRSSVIGRSGREALEAIAGAYWDFARAHPGRYAATIRDPGDDEELRDATLRAAEALTRVLESFGLTGADEVHAHRVVWSGIHGFLTLEHAGVMRRPASVRESYRRMIGIYADAFAPAVHTSDGQSRSAVSPSTRA